MRWQTSHRAMAVVPCKGGRRHTTKERQALSAIFQLDTKELHVESPASKAITTPSALLTISLLLLVHSHLRLWAAAAAAVLGGSQAPERSGGGPSPQLAAMLRLGAGRGGRRVGLARSAGLAPHVRHDPCAHHVPAARKQGSPDIASEREQLEDRGLDAQGTAARQIEAGCIFLLPNVM